MDNTRFRARGTPLISHHRYTTEQRYVSCSNLTWAETSNDADAVSGEYSWMRDVITPDFHRRSSKGEIFMSPMESFRDVGVLVQGDGLWRQKNTGSQLTCDGVLQPFYEARASQGEGPAIYAYKKGILWPAPDIKPEGVISGSDLNDFIVEHSTKVQNGRGRPDHDLWESLAELDKTLALLPQMLKALRGIVPRGNPLNYQKKLSEVWLMYRYGIKPLLSDVEGVMKGLKKSTGLIRKTTRSTGKLDAHKTEVLIHAGDGYNFNVMAENHDEVTVRCMSLDEYEATLAFNLGFSAKGLATLPWELVKYSFVIDWFTNVGDYLGSIVPLPFVKQLGSCIVIKRLRTINLSMLPNQPVTGWNFLRSSTGSYIRTHASYNRVAGLGGMPKVVIRSNFRFDNLVRSLDALSLLLQKLKG
jgi:hypothetical protein